MIASFHAFFHRTMKPQTITRRDDSLCSDEPTLDISSLIDVCFLLLIYFLVTTTIQPREQDLKMSLPVPGEASPLVSSPIIIEIKQSGEVVVNPGDAAEIFESDVDSRSLPQLKGRLGMISIQGVSRAPSVTLRVHDDVGQQRYVDVLNCLASAGIQRIALQD